MGRVTHQYLTRAGFVLLGQIRAGAKGCGSRVAAVVGWMDQRGRIIGEVHDQRDIGGRGMEPQPALINDLDRIRADAAGGGVTQHIQACSHGIAVHRAIAPAVQIEDHVVRRKVVTVVPADAGAQVQVPDGGVVIRLPAFQEHAAQRSVRLVFDQIFKPASAEVGLSRPCPEARIAGRAGLHIHAQAAARNGNHLLRPGGCGQANQ